MFRFLNDIIRIASPDYVPTDEDIIACYKRARGLVKMNFSMGGVDFKIVDWSRRNSHKKWIDCFYDLDCVIFFIAPCDFSQTLWEDDTTNCVTEALTLLEYVCNNEWFKNTPVVVVFTKIDLFAERINVLDPFKYGFTDYEGGMSFNRGLDYFVEHAVRIVDCVSRRFQVVACDVTDIEVGACCCVVHHQFNILLFC